MARLLGIRAIADGWKTARWPARTFGSKIIRKKNALVGALLIIVLTVLSVMPSAIATHSPFRQSLANRLEPPGATNLLGTDNFGRDLYSRLVYGARISLSIGLASVALSATIGVFLGLLSGYFGGVYDRVITMVTEWIIAFPMVLLAISILAMLGPGINNMILAIGIVGIPHFTRLVRSQTLAVRSTEFVEAARAGGASTARILVRHILVNIIAALMVLASMRIAQAILAEAALSFLGLGLPPPTPSWGIMIAEGRQHLGTAPWIALFPGWFIMTTVLAFNLLGDGMRDVFDPRLRS